MINWFIIILIVAGILVLMKVSHLKHSRHKLTLMIFVILLLFFIASLYFVAIANHIDMTTVNGFGIGMKVYAGWLLNSFNNIKVLTGNVIGMDWRATNGTIGNTSLVDTGKKAGEVVVNTTVNTINKIKPNTPKPITTYK